MAKATFQAGAPCWLDLMTSDVDRAKDFYGKLLGWEFEQGDEEKYGGYVTATKNGELVAGIMAKGEGSPFPDLWSTYLGTNDADVTVAKVKEAGGTVLMEPMDVPDQGRMGMVQDVGGAAVGIWEPGPMAGYGTTYEVGTPYWHELFTRTYEPTLDFYRNAFDWDVSVVGDSDDFRYATLGADDNGRAGVMDASAWLPEPVPAHWRVYFGVEDAAASAELVKELGGQVLDGPEDTPYGKIVTIQDPMGATLLIASGFPASA